MTNPDPIWAPAPYCPPIIFERWRTGLLTGDAKHQLVVRVRQGHFKRGYLDTSRIDTGVKIDPPGVIWEGINTNCWKKQWVPQTDWVVLPQIQSADYTTSFQNIGEVGGSSGSGSGQTSSVLTVVMDNVDFAPVTGPGGLYHTVKRGYFSPTRGVHVSTRPGLWGDTPWTDVLNGGYQIELWEGYGPDGDPSVMPLATPIEQTINGFTMQSCAPPDTAIVRTWTGIVETCEMASDPDVITITARDFGLTFTDQRCMGYNKAKEIRAPTHFADRKQVLGQIEIAGPYQVSSGHQVNEGWISAGHSSPTTAQWIEIDLPAGYYQDFFWAPRYDNMEMWLSLYAGDGGITLETEAFGDTHFAADTWVDWGIGNNPDGIPFLRHWPAVPKGGARWRFTKTQQGSTTLSIGEHWFKVSDGSKLRITLSNTHHDASQPNGNSDYFAGDYHFYAFKFGTNPSVAPGLQVNAKDWILIEDAADVVRMVIIWCGFPEWNVENFGWTIAHPLVYGEDKFFMDIINDILAQGNTFFWVAPPTMDDRSLGVPVLRHQTATDGPIRNMTEVRDVDMLEAINMTWDNSNLPHVIRVRGNITKDGQILDQDTQRRFMATYYPPWSGDLYTSLANPGTDYNRPWRDAAIWRHFSQTLGMNSTIGLDSDEECLFGCVLIAIQFALGMLNGTFQIAGLPMFNLNMQMSLVDEGSGTNSRLWVASIESHHKMGPNGAWHMTIGGALIDTEDFDLITQDYVWAWWNQNPEKQVSTDEANGFRPTSLGIVAP